MGQKSSEGGGVTYLKSIRPQVKLNYRRKRNENKFEKNRQVN